MYNIRKYFIFILRKIFKFVHIRCPAEVGLHKSAAVIVKEMAEGEEKSEFWEGLGSRDRSLYNSLLKGSELVSHECCKKITLKKMWDILIVPFAINLQCSHDCSNGFYALYAYYSHCMFLPCVHIISVNHQADKNCYCYR